MAGKISGWWKSRRVLSFFLSFPSEPAPASIFIRLPPVSLVPPVFLPFFLLQPRLPLTDTLAGNEKQAASEKMKAGRDGTGAGSEIALESA